MQYCVGAGSLNSTQCARTHHRYTLLRSPHLRSCFVPSFRLSYQSSSSQSAFYPLHKDDSNLARSERPVPICRQQRTSGPGRRAQSQQKGVWQYNQADMPKFLVGAAALGFAAMIAGPIIGGALLFSGAFSLAAFTVAVGAASLALAWVAVPLTLLGFALASGSLLLVLPLMLPLVITGGAGALAFKMLRRPQRHGTSRGQPGGRHSAWGYGSDGVRTIDVEGPEDDDEEDGESVSDPVERDRRDAAEELEEFDRLLARRQQAQKRREQQQSAL